MTNNHNLHLVTRDDHLDKPRPLSLLDLPDDLLKPILSLAHDLNDYDLPLPSFGAHWENYARHSSEEAVKQYLPLRTVCKRFRDLLPLRGLYVRVATWKKVIDLQTLAPQSYLDGIRYLRLDIVSDLCRTHIVSTWCNLTVLLSSMTNLEELAVLDLPLCRHSGPGTLVQHLRHPLTNFLPRVKALTIEPFCHACLSELPRLFIPAAPNLRQLRVTLGSSWPDCTNGIEAALSSWAERHDMSGRVQTLFLRYEEGPGTISQLIDWLPTLARLCPKLEILRASMYDDKLFVRPLKVMSENGNGSVDFGRPDLQPSGSTSSIMFKSLEACAQASSPFRSLLDLDIGLEIDMDGRPYPDPQNHVLQRDEPWPTRDGSDYYGGPLTGYNAASLVEWESSLKESMISMAKRMVRAIPYLTRGHFWEQFGAHKEDEETFLRWI